MRNTRAVMSEQTVERLRAGYGAWNRGELDQFVGEFDPNAKLYLFDVALQEVVYSGREGVRKVFEDLMESFEYVRFEPTELRDTGDRVFVAIDARFRGRTSGAEVADEQFHVWTFQGDSVTELRTYVEREPALEAAGLAH
jgi:ketosteroid isomerase-like protein